jgi:hypothetical protein
MLQFLQSCQWVSDRPAPAVQAPDQHKIDLAATRRLEDALAGFLASPRRSSLRGPAGRSSSRDGRHSHA